MPGVRTTSLKYQVLTADPSDGPLEEGTYFVVRDTDLFGPAVLYSYVHIIQTQLELNRLRPSLLTSEEVTYLRNLEEYVLDLAQEWQRRGEGHIPD